MTRARDLAAFVSNADGDIKFDTDTLFIDSSTNNVGIGTTSPSHPSGSGLTVFNSTVPRVALKNDTTGNTATDGFEIAMSGNQVFLQNREDSDVFLTQNATTRLSIKSAEAVFNDNGSDYDFRVESDNNANMFFIDASENEISTGTSVNTTFDTTFAITRNDHGSLGDFAGTLLLNDDTTTTSQSGGSIVFGGQDGSSARGFAKIIGGKANSTSGNYEGSVMIKTRTNGDSDLKDRVRIKGTEMVINEVSEDYDFRVESNSNAYMFYVDAGNDVVNINSTQTDARFMVQTNGQTDESPIRIPRDRAVRIHKFNGSSGGSTKTVTVDFGDNGLTGACVTLDISGHKFNNGNSFFYIRKVFAIMEENGTGRVNSDQSSNNGWTLGNATGKVGSVSVTYPAGGQTRATFTVDGEYDTKIWAQIEGHGASGANSISVA